jgi:hypothetical protein
MMRAKRTGIAAAALIVLMLGGLWLYSFSAGYRFGNDLARHDHPN